MIGFRIGIISSSRLKSVLGTAGTSVSSSISVVGAKGALYGATMSVSSSVSATGGSPSAGSILLEDGFVMLLETGDEALLEAA